MKAPSMKPPSMSRRARIGAAAATIAATCTVTALIGGITAAGGLAIGMTGGAFVAWWWSR